MLIIYNDYKNEDWLKHKGGLPKDTIIIINNETRSAEVLEHLWRLGYKPLYSEKLCENPEGYCNALDAENYNGDINYPSIVTSKYMYPEVMFPEDLGGEKYKGYKDFLLKIRPRLVCMERTYNVWKPWEILKFWLRNKYLRDKGFKVAIGYWPEAIWPIFRPIQYWSARIISGNSLFYYSETKSLPRLIKKTTPMR